MVVVAGVWARGFFACGCVVVALVVRVCGWREPLVCGGTRKKEKRRIDTCHERTGGSRGVLQKRVKHIIFDQWLCVCASD